jgi:hypothetical protein
MNRESEIPEQGQPVQPPGTIVAAEGDIQTQPPMRTDTTARLRARHQRAIEAINDSLRQLERSARRQYRGRSEEVRQQADQLAALREGHRKAIAALDGSDALEAIPKR